MGVPVIVSNFFAVGDAMQHLYIDGLLCTENPIISRFNTIPTFDEQTDTTR